jgi:periplasmic protein TonB
MKIFTLTLILLIALLKANAQADTLHIITDTGKSAFFKVEIESEFPGGPSAWLKYLNSHLTYPNKAVRKRIQGTVLLQFIVDKEGRISELRALSGDPILEEAALKAMEDSPRWIPAIQDGRAVKSYKKQPIVFKLSAN